MVPEATMATTREVVAEEDCGGEHCGYLPQVIYRQCREVRPMDRYKYKYDTWRREVARMPMANPITGLVILAEANSSSWSRWEERRRNDLEMRQDSRMA